MDVSSGVVLVSSVMLGETQDGRIQRPMRGRLESLIRYA